MPCNTYSQYRALNELDRTLRVLTRTGFGPLSEPYEALRKIRGELINGLGVRIPKRISLLKLLAGLSPGTVKLFYDTDSGWFTEAREKEGAPPVYRHVGEDTAMAVLKGEVTHEQFERMKVPDEYLGE